MKKAGQLLAVLTAASVLLSGCEKLKDVTTTSVYVSKNGVVTEAIVEDYSKDDDYTEDELKVFVEDDIKKFTEERGDADSVKLEKCQIKEDKVEIRMEYGDYQSYADYHGRIITEQNFSQARWMRQKKRDMIFPLPLSILKAMRFQSKMRSKALSMYA